MAILSDGAPALPEPISALVVSMQDRLDRLPARLRPQRAFLATYQRTTAAIGAAIERGWFEDNPWVERWEVRFAEVYLSVLDAELAGAAVPKPWALAFAAPPTLPPLRHALLGLNAHVNYDLPRALLAVISDDEFTDDVLMDQRHRDHERIDEILSARVAAEGEEITTPSSRTRVDRLLAPLNRSGARRFLRESRHKCWHNTLALHEARVAGPAEYDALLAELETLCAAKIAEVLEPRQVLLHLAVAGFGVRLPAR